MSIKVYFTIPYRQTKCRELLMKRRNVENKCTFHSESIGNVEWLNSKT